MGQLQPCEAELPTDQRLLSLDALRGFDMFWIIGGAEVAKALADVSGWRWAAWLAGQMRHPEWHGFTLYDLIFPTFLFLAGAAMPFSLTKRVERGDSRWQLYRHVVVRGLSLVVLGMVYNGLLQFDWPNTRLPSVLGRIGLAYMCAALIFLNAGVRGQLLWACGLLVAYWAALKFIPVPGYGAGDLAPGHTLTDYIDRSLTPGRLLHGIRDPVGLFGTLPAVSTALAGVLTGQLLKGNRHGGYGKTAAMIIAAVCCLIIAQLWDQDFPINKNLWSSSFVLHCAGWTLLLLAAFYLVIDVWRVRSWAQCLIVIGSNSIFIYLACRVVDFEHTTHFLFDGALRRTGALQPLLWALAEVFVKWLLLLGLYKNLIFFRI